MEVGMNREGFAEMMIFKRGPEGRQGVCHEAAGDDHSARGAASAEVLVAGAWHAEKQHKAQCGCAVVNKQESRRKRSEAAGHQVIQAL